MGGDDSQENVIHFTSYFEYNPAMILTATIEKLPEARAVVTLSGPMTLGMSLKLVDTQVQSAISEGVTKMVFDMASVDYVDSAGLGVVVYAYGKLNRKNGALRLCGVSPRILSVLQLTKTDTFLAIDPSREESLAALPA
jgi:anti-sigma B factor antagonist